MYHPPMEHDWSREEVVQIEEALGRIQGEKLEALVQGLKKLKRQEKATVRTSRGQIVHTLKDRTKALLNLPKSFYTGKRTRSRQRMLYAAVKRLRDAGYEDEADYAIKKWGR